MAFDRRLNRCCWSGPLGRGLARDDLQRATAGPARFERHVPRHPEHPRHEARARREVVDPAKRAHERLLRGVGGEGRAPEEIAQEAMHPGGEVAIHGGQARSIARHAPRLGLLAVLAEKSGRREGVVQAREDGHALMWPEADRSYRGRPIFSSSSELW